MTLYGSRKGKLIPREIPIERFKAIFEYCPEYGGLVTKVDRPNSPKGSRPSAPIPTGYRLVSLEGVSYYIHRVVWAIVNNEQPKIIDHINGNKSDNRIENLRSVTSQQNTLAYFASIA